MVLVDYHSKWVYHKFLGEIVTESVMNFMEEVFRIEGFPNAVVTDNGVQFKSEAMKQFLQNRGIKHYTTALYSPQGNGLVERMNRVIKETVQLAKAASIDAVTAVQNRLWSYHNTPHSTTGVSPFALLRGRCSSNSLSPAWVVERTKGNGRIPGLDVVKEGVRKAQEQSKVRYDRKKGGREVNFEIGDIVRVRKPGHVYAGVSKFYPSTKVTAVGRHAVRVLDGRWWSKRDVARLSPRCSEHDARSERDKDTGGMEMIFASQESDSTDNVDAALRSEGEDASEKGCVNRDEEVREVHSKGEGANPYEVASQDTISPAESPDVTVVRTPVARERPKRIIHKPKFLSEYILG